MPPTQDINGDLYYEDDPRAYPCVRCGEWLPRRARGLATSKEQRFCSARCRVSWHKRRRTVDLRMVKMWAYHYDQHHTHDGWTSCKPGSVRHLEVMANMQATHAAKCAKSAPGAANADTTRLGVWLQQLGDDYPRPAQWVERERRNDDPRS